MEKRKVKVFGERYVLFAEDLFVVDEPKLTSNEENILSKENIYGVFNTIDEAKEYIENNKETIIVYVNKQEEFFIAETLKYEYKEAVEAEEEIINRKALLDEEKNLMEQKDNKDLYEVLLQDYFFEGSFEKEDIDRILGY